MKNLLAFTVLILFSAMLAQAQQQEIEIRKSQYFQNNLRLQPKDMLRIMKPEPAAYKEMEAAKANIDAANVFGFAGGFLIGWPLGTAMAGGEPNWALAGIGAGLVVISIPLYTAYNQRAKKAVALYNESLSARRAGTMQLQLSNNSHGLGLLLKF